jgi:hypothetical protein
MWACPLLPDRTSMGQPILTRRYSLFGLAIDCPFDLPEGRRIDDLSSAPDVCIELALGVADSDNVNCDYYLSSSDSVTFAVQKVGRFDVVGGKRIRITAARSADLVAVRVYLLGSAMGAILHQRGVVPIHAGAVEKDGKVFAFSGAQGIGKSTLAACLSRSGFRVVCDDVLPLDRIDRSGVSIRPSLEFVKLLPDAEQAISGFHAPLETINRLTGKRYYQIEGADTSMLDLTALYFLQAQEDLEDVQIDETPPLDMVNRFMTNIYRPNLAVILKRERQMIQAAVAFQKEVRCFTVSRPLNTVPPDMFAGIMADHFRSL